MRLERRESGVVWRESTKLGGECEKLKSNSAVCLCTRIFRKVIPRIALMFHTRGQHSAQGYSPVSLNYVYKMDGLNRHQRFYTIIVLAVSRGKTYQCADSNPFRNKFFIDFYLKKI